MTTSRFCKACHDFHDLDEQWPRECYGHFGANAGGAATIQIIKDIQPYKAVAVDVATGKRPVIKTRSDHREFLKRNKYVEIGTEIQRPRAVTYNDITPREIKQTIEQLSGRRS